MCVAMATTARPQRCRWAACRGARGRVRGTGQLPVGQKCTPRAKGESLDGTRAGRIGALHGVILLGRTGEPGYCLREIKCDAIAIGIAQAEAILGGTIAGICRGLLRWLRVVGMQPTGIQICQYWHREHQHWHRQ